MLWKPNLNTAAKKMLPVDARLMVPGNPSGAEAIQSMDIDADGKLEAVVTYEWRDGVRALLLRKDGMKWKKVSEVTGTGYDVDYLGFADVTGDGKMELLIGWKTGSMWNELYIMTLQEQTVKRLDMHTYTKMELMADERVQNNTDKTNVAFWGHVTGDAYRVEVLSWDGYRMAPLENAEAYFKNKVVPYYAKKVIDEPSAALYWYYLADSQMKAGMNEMALESVERGLALNSSYPSSEEFAKLKSKIENN